MESKNTVTLLHTTEDSKINSDHHGRGMSLLPTEDRGDIQQIHYPKLVKKENSRETVEREKEHLEAKDCKECLQINYYKDKFKSEDSKYDSSSQDDKEGIQQVSSCILPCSNFKHDQQTSETKDKVSKQSAMTGPELSTTPHDTTGHRTRGKGGNITLMQDPRLVKKENSGESLESEKELLQAKDCEECLQINYYIDKFKSEDSNYDSSSQDDKKGLQYWSVSSSSILPCSNMKHDQKTVVTNDMLSKQSAISGAMTQLDTVCVDTAPDNTLSYIAVPLSNQNEEEPVLSTTPPPIVIQPEPEDLIYQVHNEQHDTVSIQSAMSGPELCGGTTRDNTVSFIFSNQNEKGPVMSTPPHLVVIKPRPVDSIYQINVEANDPSERTGNNYTETTSSMNSPLQDCETSLINNDSCVSVQQQLDTIPFKCTICGRGFTHADHLKKHNKIHTVEGPGICNVCGKRFASSHFLRNHQVTHEGNETFTCTVCVQVFTSKFDLNRHLSTHASQKCTVCGKYFLSSRGVARHHLIEHADEVSFNCPVCPRLFRSKLEQTRHLRIHNSHECTVCGKSFTTSHFLQNHQRTHTQDGPYTCTMCTKVFSSKWELTTHMSTHASRLCKVCGNLFPLNNFAAHMRTHTKKPYVCTICDEGFTTSHLLQNHRLAHTGDGHGRCGVCGKVLSSFLELTRHMPTHTLKMCQACGKNIVLDKFAAHMRNHTGVKPSNICTICGKGFNLISNLSKHWRTHCGKMPFK